MCSMVTWFWSFKRSTLALGPAIFNNHSRNDGRRIVKAYVNSFWLPKEGNSHSEYEDAFWPLESCEADFPVRVAAADGATDAVFKRLVGRHSS